MPIFGIRGRAQIDYPCHIMAKHGVLKQENGTGNRNCHTCIQGDKQQSCEKQQPHDGSCDIDDLNAPNIRAQPWNDAENTNRKLDHESD